MRNGSAKLGNVATGKDVSTFLRSSVTETSVQLEPLLQAEQHAVEPHMLSLLKHLKHQLNLQSSVMNLPMSRLNGACEPASEMPDDVSFL
ncbi:uncharacterized protein V6R79_024555 [Siganus canaliculatus]